MAPSNTDEGGIDVQLGRVPDTRAPSSSNGRGLAAAGAVGILFGVVVTGAVAWGLSRRSLDQGIATCRDSISSLGSSAKNPSATAEDLREIIRLHLERCRPVMERLDAHP